MTQDDVLLGNDDRIQRRKKNSRADSDRTQLPARPGSGHDPNGDSILAANREYSFKQMQIPAAVRYEAGECLEWDALPGAAAFDEGKKNSDEDESDKPDKLSYKKLEAHINSKHPRRQGEPFGVWDAVGHYDAAWAPCIKKDKVTALAKEIGLGPSMFLMNTKMIGVFFFIISLLNIPVFMFLWHSDDRMLMSLPEVLAKLTLASLNPHSVSCNKFNYVTKTQLKIECPHKYDKLTKLEFMGVTQKNA